MDQGEFTAFYHETAPALRGYIRRVSGDEQAADDLLQEAYLRFLRAKPAAEDRAAMKAYLYKAATAAIYDRWRKLRRERLWSLAFRFREETPPAAPGHNPGHQGIFVGATQLHDHVLDPAHVLAGTGQHRSAQQL